MNIIPFAEQLLPSAAKLCRLSMEYDIMPDFLLREKIFGDKDYNPDLILTAVEDSSGELTGFIHGVVKQRENEKIGYIKLFCVNPNFRRKGLGTRLHGELIERMKNRGAEKIRVYESFPNYFMPGVDVRYKAAVSFFNKQGYRKFNETVNLSAELSRQSFDTQDAEIKLRAKSIIFRRAEEADKEKSAKFVFSKFRYWLEEIYETFGNEPITLFIAEKEGEIIGFSAHEGNNKGTGWFGPMGTDESYRGIGIGAVLLKKSLLDLKVMGYSRAIIPWAGPIQFYMENCECKIERVFWRFEKME